MELNERWMRLACVVAGADYDLLRDANAIDRMTVGGNAVVLMLVGTLAVTAWSAFFASFLPLHVALPSGFLIGAIVFMLDRAMSVSDWSLTGVLQTGRPTLAFWLKVAGRAGVSLVLAVATAAGVLLAFCADAIDHHIRTERQVRNRPVVEEFALRKQEARARLMGPLESELEVLKAERLRLQRTLEERESTLSEARQRAAEARVEAGRERDGGLRGYVRGAGPRFRDAQRLEREAQLAAQQSSQDGARLQQRFDQFAPTIAAKTNELRDAVAAAAAEEQRIDDRMRQDSRWNPERKDPLSRWMALEALRHDPAMGDTVARFDLTAKATLITLELAFLMIKLFLSPASVYVVRLTRRTKEEAAREVHEYQEFLRRLRRGSPEDGMRKPSMRLLGFGGHAPAEGN